MYMNLIRIGNLKFQTKFNFESVQWMIKHGLISWLLQLILVTMKMHMNHYKIIIQIHFVLLTSLRCNCIIHGLINNTPTFISVLKHVTLRHIKEKIIMGNAKIKQNLKPFLEKIYSIM